MVNTDISREELYAQLRAKALRGEFGWTPEQIRAFRVVSEFPLAKYPWGFGVYPEGDEGGKITMYWRDCGPGLRYTMVVEIDLDGAVEWYVRDLLTGERFGGTEFVVG